MRYPVVLHKDDGVRYGVTVPDLPGCFSAGDPFEEALASAEEAIELHLEGLAEEGHEPPAPGALATYQALPEYAGGAWALVDVDVSRFKGKAESLPRNHE